MCSEFLIYIFAATITKNSFDLIPLQQLCQFSENMRFSSMSHESDPYDIASLNGDYQALTGCKVNPTPAPHFSPPIIIMKTAILRH